MVNRIANAERKQRKIRKIIKPNIEKFLEFKNYSLKYRLKFLLSNLGEAIEKDYKIKNLIKAMNNLDFDKTDIESEITEKSDDYKSGDIKNIESIVKYTLLCLLDHNDNARYQLLYKNNKSYVSINGIEEKKLIENGIKKQGEKNMNLISLAEGYYTFFKTKVNDLLIFYLYYNEQSVSKPIIPEIRSYICDIYNGIVLLTVSSNNTELIVYDKKPFTSRVLLNDKPFTSRVLNDKPSTSKVIKGTKKIVEFFKNNKNYLIIKKYDGDIKNCIYDCMMQIIYKIVSVLILYIKKYKQYLTTLPHNK